MSAFSFVQYPISSTTPGPFTITFPYIAAYHVEVRKNGVLLTSSTDYTFPTASSIQLVANAVNGDVVEIRRNSLKKADGSTGLLVDWSNSAKITEANLDKADQQVFYTSQEAFDAAANAMQLASDNTYDATSKRIKNVANGTNANDAINKSQLDAAALAPVTPIAASIGSTPSGTLSSTNVQAALNELDAEKATPAFVSTAGNAAFPRSYLAGLGLSNNAVDPTNDIDIAVGEARDSTHSANIVLASSLTKQLDAVWAVGTNAGMRASGAALTQVTYHIFLIRRPDTGVVDVAADTSVTGANIAANTNANYTQIRRIGSIIRGGVSIVSFKQDGDKFVHASPFTDVNVVNPGTAAVTRSLTLPTGIRLEAILIAGLGSVDAAGGIGFRLSDLSTTDIFPTLAISQVGVTYSGAGLAANAAAECRVFTDTSAQVRSRVSFSSANVTVLIGTLGWIDRRGRDA